MSVVEGYDETSTEKKSIKPAERASSPESRRSIFDGDFPSRAGVVIKSAAAAKMAPPTPPPADTADLLIFPFPISSRGWIFRGYFRCGRTSDDDLLALIPDHPRQFRRRMKFYRKFTISTDKKFIRNS
ncbi:hypothetical protein GWI33_008419 [Rhynchophorus ferrugineus]|uniref:Uncharacterized protein n=1 Tax=Rhynchophorus ferrugineus TaxID=354439 RepID=A0A834MFZ3_RHYFE|nr:hypothetical protein GWI33_008419 [Rhynchophorus ferrugineus]